MNIVLKSNTQAFDVAYAAAYTVAQMIATADRHEEIPEQLTDRKDFKECHKILDSDEVLLYWIKQLAAPSEVSLAVGKVIRACKLSGDRMLGVVANQASRAMLNWFNEYQQLTA